jgi:hypothetical protein
MTETAIMVKQAAAHDMPGRWRQAEKRHDDAL